MGGCHSSAGATAPQPDIRPPQIRPKDVSASPQPGLPQQTNSEVTPTQEVPSLFSASGNKSSSQESPNSAEIRTNTSGSLKPADSSETANRDASQESNVIKRQRSYLPPNSVPLDLNYDKGALLLPEQPDDAGLTSTSTHVSADMHRGLPQYLPEYLPQTVLSPKAGDGDCGPCKKRWEQACLCQGERSASGDGILDLAAGQATLAPRHPCEQFCPCVGARANSIESKGSVLGPLGSSIDPGSSKLECLVAELFRLHDLNGDGFLDETELIQLNETVTRLHHGQDADVADIAAKYRDLFRSKLDSQGRPVAFDRFRIYVLEMLADIDRDLASQEMIMEQFTMEAGAARVVVFAGAPSAERRSRNRSQFWEIICECN